ncbi:MAG: Ig-like domain repeat protein [Actinomycetota bacterium]
MKGRLAAAAIGVLLAVTLSVGSAAAATGVQTRVGISTTASTVSGSPIAVHVRLRDASGKSVVGALIRLEAPTTFMGKDSQEILDEARTDRGGKATLSFAPTVAGTTTVTALYSGDAVFAGSQASLEIEVSRPVAGYRQVPVGISAPWAKSPFVLIPFLAVWVAYLLVLGLARKVRRGASVDVPTI